MAESRAQRVRTYERNYLNVREVADMLVEVEDSNERLREACNAALAWVDSMRISHGTCRDAAESTSGVQLRRKLRTALGRGE